MSNAGRKKRMVLGMDIAEQWGTGTSNARAEHILTINIITILFTGLHAVDFVDTPAYALILLPENLGYVNLGGGGAGSLCSAHPAKARPPPNTDVKEGEVAKLLGQFPSGELAPNCSSQ